MASAAVAGATDGKIVGESLAKGAGFERADAHAQAKRTAVLVVAMHRSGTSALSRTLNLLGCEMPPKLIGADQWNSAGYWESKPIKDLNEEILVSGGSEWSEWQEFNPQWFRSSVVQRFRDRAIELVRSEFGDAPLFVFKDPRLSLLMPFWRDILEELGIEPVVIHPLRNPIEVARSLERRNKFLMPKGILLWLRYTLDGERGTRGLRRFFTTYDDLLEDQAGFVQRSQEALGVYWPRNSDKVRREMAAFLSSGMRHHRDDVKGLRALTYAAEWVEATYQTLLDFAANGETADGRDALDTVSGAYTAGVNAFGSLAKDNEERFARVSQLQQERDKLLEQAKATEALKHSEEEHRAVQKEREELRQKAQSLEAAVAQGRQQRDEMKAAQVEIEARAVAAQERADAIQQAKTALEQRHLATQKERDGLRDLKAQYEAAVADSASAATALNKRDEVIAGLNRDLLAKDSALEESARELASLGAVLADAEKAAGDHQVKIAQTEQLAQQWESEIEQLKAELQDARIAGDAAQRALRHELAQTESALRQRQLESEQAGEELAAVQQRAEAERAAQEAASTELNQKLATEQARAVTLEAARVAAEQNVQVRFNEIASITELLAGREGELTHVNYALADARRRIGEHADNERRFVDVMQDFAAALQEKTVALDVASVALNETNARVVQLEEQHGSALQSLATALDDLQQQKHMLSAVVAASREDMEARQNAAEGARQTGEQIYRQFLATLHALLAQAVLPFPTLTRRKTLERQRRILLDHASFDPIWYVAAHDDLRDREVDPYRHYIRHGVREGRAPNAAMEALRAGISSPRR